MNGNETHLVFVYGTLRKEESNHRILAESELVLDQCWIGGILVDTGFGYPAVVKTLDSNISKIADHRKCDLDFTSYHTDESKPVFGEVYRVTSVVLEELDSLEGYYGPYDSRNLYNRVSGTIYYGTGTLKAYVYIWADEDTAQFPLIQSGDWKNR